MFNFLKGKRNKKEEPENIKEIVEKLRDLEKEIEKTKKELEIFRKESSCFIQKIGMVRYNPFSDVGSNQSFSVAFLDKDDNGVVITSLYSREENRVYGKTIKKGQSEYLLSDEEKQAIEKAKYGEGKQKFNNSSSNSSSNGTR